MGNVALKVTSSAVLGGTIDEIGGGKFANGAITGAYGMLFNDLRHDDDDPRKSATNGGGDDFKNYVEKANGITGNPLASFGLQYGDDILRVAKITDKFKIIPGLNVFANTIGGLDYGITMADPNVRADQKMLKTATTGVPLGLSTTSMILTGIGVGGSFATGIGEAAVGIGIIGAGAEKLYNDVIIPTYQNIESRLNSINWWGWQMGF
jgi:hypothetical protein